MKPSERYTEEAGLMMAFRNAFVDLHNHGRWESGDFGPVLVSATDHMTWQTKRGAVAAAAGAASRAYGAHGGTFTLRNIAYVMNNVDPVTNWEMSLKDPEQLSPQTVIESVESAVASAIQLAKEAAQRERGLTGLIAAFLRWPSHLREAVGPDNAAQRRAATAIGYFGQIVVGVVAAAIFALLLKLLGQVT